MHHLRPDGGDPMTAVDVFTAEEWRDIVIATYNRLPIGQQRAFTSRYLPNGRRRHPDSLPKYLMRGEVEVEEVAAALRHYAAEETVWSIRRAAADKAAEPMPKAPKITMKKATKPSTADTILTGGRYHLRVVR